MCCVMGKYTKEEAIKVITSCAERYREELMDRSLLFICIDRNKRTSWVEFSFHDYNFLHLTGIKVCRKQGEPTREGGKATGNELAAADFFKRCLAHKLSPSDFDFSDDGTTHMKLDVLPSVINKNLSANMIGSYASTKPKLYTEKLAGGTKACVGFVLDAITKGYVPNTVLKEDIRNHVNDYVRVIAIYRKNKTEEKYRELTYRAKKVDWSSIKYPDPYGYIQDSEDGCEGECSSFGETGSQPNPTKIPQELAPPCEKR